MREFPLVGITVAYNREQDAYWCRRSYIEAVLHSGGMPHLLFPVEEEEVIAAWAAEIDALLLSGGGDVHPAYYGEEPYCRLENVFRPRDAFEIALTRRVLALEKPVLGICRGMQVLNVALGGSLYQDLELQVPGCFPHQQEAPRSQPSHQVRLSEGSRLGQLLGTASLRVNSLHHQAVKKVAPGLVPVAWAGDGVVEAVEAPEYAFVVGVQWHPEAMWRTEEKAALLFRAFVAAARGRRRS